MLHSVRSILRLATAPLLLLSCLASASQTAIPQSNRVAEEPDLRPTVVLAGQLPAWVNPAREQGPAPSNSVVGLTFVLRRSPERQAAFEQRLADQTNPASPLYHQWLTPAQIGEQFGPSTHDVDAVVRWLRASGLQVDSVAPSRIFVEASGPAPVAAAALGTSFRLYTSLGHSHLAASSDPVIPQALAPVISSIGGLAETDLMPQSHAEPPSQQPAARGGVAPQYTSSAGNHYLFPKDFATIFDINPLYAAGINGAGQHVAVIGRSDINLSDIAAFESRSALPSNVPNVIVAATGNDPGVVTTDEGESDLDLQRVIGVAPGVQADFVISGSANGHNGIYVAAQYEVQTVLDPVLSLSYGSCEANAGASGVALWSNLFSQAAAEGISVFVSSGDSGAAFCDTQFATPPATQFRSVNYICTNPYTTCVGGTELAEAGNPSRYWSSTNSTGYESALGYIPEGGWNDPTSTQANTGITTYLARASGGGASVYTSKPAYQVGIGVPADGQRDVPDVAFPASNHDGYAGCEADITTFNGDCSKNGLVIFSGTSAAAPGWAGVTALLNQRTNSRQGNLNPALYRLAANPANGAFHDVTPATTGLSSCDVTIPSLCNNSTPAPNSLTGGQVGFPVQTGYDQVTGWGSVDVASFVAAAIVPYQPVAVTVASSLNPVQARQGVTFTATVTSSAGGTPTGTVQFLSNGAVLGSATLSGSGTAVSPALSFNSAGTYSITAVYSGDFIYVPGTSAALSLQVTPGPTLTVSATPSSLSLGAGATSGNTATLLFASSYGLTGTVTASCTVAAVSGTVLALAPTCSVSGGGPLASGGSVAGGLTIGTVAPHAAMSRQPRMAGLLAAGGGSLAALVCLLFPARRRRMTQLAALAFAMMGVGLLGGCGAGNFSGSTLVGGTTPGSYVVTVTGSAGGVQGTAAVPLSVQ